ncbi:hypothetical protein [Noviherbaspirillum galbum]|nr:hypothetical protein [Noviherbaspirillum galbum]
MKETFRLFRDLMLAPLMLLLLLGAYVFPEREGRGDPYGSTDSRD